ncbi:glycosylphosphatidylinositol anchor biosynthesis [Microbotryomycetes sp. JL221]|nr:glycosylphosphatidylinositol anchor biosynthesis [Microbotryomycetes sp. JL221]
MLASRVAARCECQILPRAQLPASIRHQGTASTSTSNTEAAATTSSQADSSLASNRRIVAAALLSRAPLVLPPQTDFERAYYNYQRKIHRALAKPAQVSTSWFFKSGSASEKSFAQFNAKVDKETGAEKVESAYEMAADEVDGADRPRVGSVDIAKYDGQLQNLERKMDRTLYLLLKKDRKEHAWQFPQGGVEAGESLLEAAQRELVEETGPNMDVWSISRAPAGAFSYAFPKDFVDKTEAKHQGAHVFFLPMRVIRGQAKPNAKEGLVDFAWLTKEEIKAKVSADYWEAVSPMLSDRYANDAPDTVSSLETPSMPLFHHGAPAREPYRKVLYLRQEAYPDNYVDSSFLSDLQRNVNVHPASLPVLLAQTLPITQHLASTFIFISVFIRLLRGSLEPTRLLLLSAMFAVILRVWAHISYPASGATRATATPINGSPTMVADSSTKEATRSNPTTAKASLGPSSSAVTPLIPLFTLYVLSPALKTLTKATTSDSIWALSGTLFCINLFLGDYRSIPTTGPSRNQSLRLPSTLPLTAALSASTVLASRLASNLAVFSLLLFATLWFGPFPLLRSDLTMRPTILLTMVLAAVALASLVSIGGGAISIAILSLSGVAFVAPLGRGWLMIRYKDRIRGPWDQAVPIIL